MFQSWHGEDLVLCIKVNYIRFIIFDCELCSRSPKHSLVVVVVVVKPLVKRLQICIFLVSRIKLDYTGSQWIILDQIGSNLIKLDQTGSNWIKKDQILKKPFWKSLLLKKDHIGSNWIKLYQIRSNFEKAILKKTCS
jgi:hypothetical protein